MVTPFQTVASRDVSSQVLLLESGRKLGFAEYGDPAGTPVFAFHGAPGNRFQLLGVHFAAEEQNVRLIVPDRPGYGYSTYYKERKLTDWPDDVKVIADHLQIETFGVWGISAGGPHALVVAAMLPNRITGVSLAASVAPRKYFEHQMSAKEIQRLEKISPRRIKWTANIWIFLRWISALIPWRISRLFTSEPNRGLLEDEYFRDTRAIERKNFDRHSSEALAQDFALLMDDWGFELSDVTQHVKIWHGRQDTLVRLEQGELLAKEIGDSELHISDEDGHLIAGRLYREMMAAAADPTAMGSL